MLANFARHHYLTRPSLWRILAWLAWALVIGIILACFVGMVYVLYLAMTIAVPVK